MIVLNLLDSTKSDITYSITKFPDGQQLFNIPDDVDLSFIRGEKVKVIISINEFSKIELLMGAISTLRENKVNAITLYITYFIGGRSDRKFTKNGYNYIKSVISPIINSLGAETVYVVDPHSDVIEATINNFKAVTQDYLLSKHIDELSTLLENSQLVSPDIGAYKKIHKIGLLLGKNNIANGRKIRDTDGKIIELEIDNLVESESYFIVDDICDGGRTIIELSKLIKNRYPMSKIYVFTTHGIFSKGFDVFTNVDLFLTTNSYSTITETDKFKIIHKF